VAIYACFSEARSFSKSDVRSEYMLLWQTIQPMSPGSSWRIQLISVLTIILHDCSPLHFRNLLVISSKEGELINTSSPSLADDTENHRKWSLRGDLIRKYREYRLRPRNVTVSFLIRGNVPFWLIEYCVLIALRAATRSRWIRGLSGTLMDHARDKQRK
jgi:hypothetical protein